MSFAVYPQPDACRAWMPTTPLPPSMSPPSLPMVCHMPKGHDGQHSNERRPSTLSRRWEGDARPKPPPVPVTAADVPALVPLAQQASSMRGNPLPLTDGEVAGILSERDIVRKMGDNPTAFLDTPVEKVMTAKVIW